jgi:hypothetical protein
MLPVEDQVTCIDGMIEAYEGKRRFNPRMESTSKPEIVTDPRQPNFEQIVSGQRTSPRILTNGFYARWVLVSPTSSCGRIISRSGLCPPPMCAVFLCCTALCENVLPTWLYTDAMCLAWRACCSPEPEARYQKRSH